MELLQCAAVSETWEAMGGLAGIDSSFGGHGDELGTFGFSAVEWNDGRPQPVAFGHGWTHLLVVQVSAISHTALRVCR